MAASELKGNDNMSQPSSPFLPVRHLVRVATLVMSAWALPGFAAPDWDIVGIKLGMTEAEARAALRAFDPDLKITPVMGVFNYSDGVNPILKTPEFLDRLEAAKGNQGASVKVYFSGPVGDVRVLGVYRMAMVPNPPTGAQFVQGLVTKYGQPSGTGRGNRMNLVWEGEGKPSCVRLRDGNRMALEAFNGVGLMDSAAVEQFLAARRGNIMGKGVLPADLTQCGAYLSYQYFGDPVRNFDGQMFDLGSMVATERLRTAWVKQMQTEAIRKREGQGQSPKL